MTSLNSLNTNKDCSQTYPNEQQPNNNNTIAHFTNLYYIIR